jgi:hypothetical protein
VTIEEARSIVRPMMLRAARVPGLSLASLRQRWEDDFWQVEDEEAWERFDSETQWSFFLLHRWDSYALRDMGVSRNWHPKVIEALERLRNRVETAEESDKELVTIEPFDFVHGEFGGNPFGDQADGHGYTERPNHTAVPDRGSGVPAFEPNEKRTDSDIAEARNEIRRLVELDAVHEGFSFAEFIASPGRGRASAAVGARLDALSRSVRSLLKLGFTQADIGAVLNRDKRRLCDLANR